MLNEAKFRVVFPSTSQHVEDSRDDPEPRIGVNGIKPVTGPPPVIVPLVNQLEYVVSIIEDVRTRLADEPAFVACGIVPENVLPAYRDQLVKTLASEDISDLETFYRMCRRWDAIMVVPSGASRGKCA
jgi:hypothetical protein